MCVLAVQSRALEDLMYEVFDSLVDHMALLTCDSTESGTSPSKSGLGECDFYHKERFECFRLSAAMAIVIRCDSTLRLPYLKYMMSTSNGSC